MSGDEGMHAKYGKVRKGALSENANQTKDDLDYALQLVMLGLYKASPLILC